MCTNAAGAVAGKASNVAAAGRTTSFRMRMATHCPLATLTISLQSAFQALPLIRPTRAAHRGNVVGMRVELLYWEGCPSHPEALADLRAAMGELGLDPQAVVLHKIDSDEDARRELFVGSPTVRIEGVDVSDPGEEPVGLTCRIYNRRDGRISPTPDPADLRDALEHAIATASERT
jgi:hypothetical protein